MSQHCAHHSPAVVHVEDQEQTNSDKQEDGDEVEIFFMVGMAITSVAFYNPCFVTAPRAVLKDSTHKLHRRERHASHHDTDYIP